MLQLGDEGPLQVGLEVAFVVAKSRELEHERVFHQVRWPTDLMGVPIATEKKTTNLARGPSSNVLCFSKSVSYDLIREG